MGAKNVIFLENIEWFDSTGESMAVRMPEEGSAEIKWGAQLTVRESQAGVFFYKGRAVHVFGAGRHTLQTGNIPVLNKIMSIPWGLQSPLRAEIYFCNLKMFVNRKWGTRDPVAFKDSELGLVRLRAYGMFTVQIVQPLLFINSLVGTVSHFDARSIDDYLGSVIVSRFNDYIGENLDSILNLPSRYDEMGEALRTRIQADFARIGLMLSQFFINSITPPPEVQQAIDDRSKLGVLRDLDKLTKMKAAMAMEKAAGNPGGAGAGMGMGVGMMMPGMLAQQMGMAAGGASAQSKHQQCPDCGGEIPVDARFCPLCGHHIVVVDKCPHCEKNLPPSARFCPRCGKAVERKRTKTKCAACGAEVLADAKFCLECGEKL